MGDINVKPAASLQQKYADRAGAATPTYTANVAATSKDQAALAVAAQATWVAALSDPKTQSRWAKRLVAAGTGKWKAKVALVGDARYRTGVSAGAPAWASDIQPYFDTLNALTLGKKLPKGDPGNSARSTAVQQALHAKKISMS